MVNKLIPETQEFGYMGFIPKITKMGIKNDYFFYEPDGKGGTLVIVKTEDSMEDRYEKLIQPFRFFKGKEK